LLPSPKEEKEGRSEAQHGRGEETHLSLGDVQMWIDDETPSVLAVPTRRRRWDGSFLSPCEVKNEGI